MKTPMVSSATSFQRPQTSLQSPMPRLPRSNVYSTRDPANPSASVHRKRFFTPSLTPKFLCAGYLNPGILKVADFYDFWNFEDSQINRKLILGWDGAVAIPSFRAESRLCDLSRPPAGSWR